MTSHTHWKYTTERMLLKLDKDFVFDTIHPMNSIEFELGQFPGGEPNFRITSYIQYPDKLLIATRFNSVEDLILIPIAVDAARRMGFGDIELLLPYFPAARQDRVCNSGESLTIKVFADLINQCKLSKVYIYSPHSEVTPALIDNCVELDLDAKFVNLIAQQQGPFIQDKEINLVIPDAGAGKRVGKIAKKIQSWNPDLKINLVRCEKVRDVSTGKLLEFHVGTGDLGRHPTIIIDDILCYGGTFVGLGELLRERNCGSLALFTSHADVLNGIEKMTIFFDKVYTTNSKKNWGQELPVENFECFNIQL